MSASTAPFVTHGSTPLCDACGEHYSERHCVDCGQHQCTWCNLEIHVPIGKRNHWRPRLYGEDPHAELERNALASADRAVEKATSEARGAVAAAARAPAAASSANGTADSSAAPSVVNQYHVDPASGRVHVTTEHFLPLTAEEGWDLLGDWDAPFLPFPCDVSAQGDRRVLVLPRDDEEETEEDEDSTQGRGHVVTERLIQRSDREMFYSFSRTVPPEWKGCPYTDMLSKFSFSNATTPAMLAAAQGETKKCVLQWSTSVLPKDPKNIKAAAESVARWQESWRAYFDKAIEEEE